MEESIGYCEAYLAQSPVDVEIRSRLFASANWMAMTYHSDSNNDQLYERWHARAIATLERLKSLPDVHARGMYEVSRWQLLHAKSLMLAGESERARKELEEGIAFVRSAPVAGSRLPELVLCEASTLAALGRWSGEFPPIRSSVQPRPGNIAIQDLEPQLAELTASRVGLLPSIVKSPYLIPRDLSAEAWSDRVITWMRSDAAKFGLDHTRIPSIGWRMTPCFWGTTRLHREAGNLAEAQRIVERLLALAGRLTRLYPDHAATYMLLSDAYVQRAKIAYVVDGEPVDGWERKALEAAIQAATLEPEDAEVRSLVKNRRARLDKLESKKKRVQS